MGERHQIHAAAKLLTAVPCDSCSRAGVLLRAQTQAASQDQGPAPVSRTMQGSSRQAAPAHCMQAAAAQLMLLHNTTTDRVP